MQLRNLPYGYKFDRMGEKMETKGLGFWVRGHSVTGLLVAVTWVIMWLIQVIDLLTKFP